MSTPQTPESEPGLYGPAPTWPSEEWDQAWDNLRSARLLDLASPEAPTYPDMITRELHRLSCANTGTGTVQGAVKLKFTAEGPPQGPAPVAALRRRLDAECAVALGHQVASLRKMSKDREQYVSAAGQVVRAAVTLSDRRPDLHHVVDGHWQATHLRQTLADYADRLTVRGQLAVSRTLRLLYACAPRVLPTGGGTPPPGMEQQLDHGQVELDMEIPSVDVDEDAYPDLLHKDLRHLAWELHAQLVQCWNALEVPQRRLVVAYWHRLSLLGPHTAAAVHLLAEGATE